MKEIKPLTSLRGIMALWVLGYHLHSIRVAPTPSVYGLFERGYLGVDFFFLLSGFILGQRYGSQFTTAIDSKTFDYKTFSKLYFAFVVRRILRLAPLNIAVTVACSIGVLYFGSAFPIWQTVQESLLIHRWPGVTAVFHAIDGPAWSISTELLANILFPIFVWFTLKPTKYVALIVLFLSSAACLWLTMMNGWELDIARANTPEPFIRCAAEFTIGMLICRWHKTHIGSTRVLLPLLFLAVLASLHFGLIDLGVVALMSVAIPLLAQDKGRIARAMSIKPLMGLGHISFSIYLTQEPILRVVRHYVWRFIDNETVQVFVFCSTTFAITVFVSWLTHKYIEVAFQSLVWKCLKSFRVVSN